MKMGIRERKIVVQEVPDHLLNVLKRTGMKWDAKNKQFTSPVSLQTLNSLLSILKKLPKTLEDERQNLINNENEINNIRLEKNVVAIRKPPVKANLYSHQIKAFNMAMKRFEVAGGFAFLMEMGTGKSLTANATAGALYVDGKIKRVLIACPTSITSVWKKEFLTFADYDFRISVLNGDKKSRLAALATIEEVPTDKLDVVVINYESVHRDGIYELLENFDADLIIADESQRIKTYNAAQSKAMHKLGAKARYRLLLTGTPITNKANDIFSQYKFLDPAIFGNNYYAFRNKYCVMGGFGNYQIIDYKHQDDLIKRAHSIALRVTKEEALDLPDQVFIDRIVKLEPSARNQYEKLRKDGIALIEGSVVNAPCVLTQILRLQQFTGGFINTDETTVPTKTSTSKLDALSDILTDVVEEEGKKIVIFARFLPELKAICKLIEKHGFKYGCIYGAISQEERGEIVDRFQNDDDVKVFVAQIATAGLGITLHAASVAVFYSLSYNFAEYAQAVARIHRIGQTEKCTYIHLIVEDSIDDKVLNVLKNKEDLASGIVDNWRKFF